MSQRQINVEIKTDAGQQPFPFVSILTNADTGEWIGEFGSDFAGDVAHDIEWFLANTPTPSVIKSASGPTEITREVEGLPTEDCQLHGGV